MPSLRIVPVVEIVDQLARLINQIVDRIFARNYDFARTNTALVFTDPGNGRHKSFSTVDLQFLGMDPAQDVEGLMNKITCLAAPFAPLDGVNDAGVSCGIYMTYQGGEATVATDQNTDKPDFTSTTLLRLILDYADSVEEAVEIARSYDLHDSAIAAETLPTVVDFPIPPLP